MSIKDTFRPGVRPDDPTRVRLRLGNYLTGEAIVPPASVNWDAPIRTWGMLGNDGAGDCFWAMCGHTLMTWTANAGTEVDPSTVDILRAYSEATGYDPRDPATDQGTTMQDGLGYWRKTGLPVGKDRHKILAYAQVNHLRVAEMQVAAALFGEVLLVIDCPDSALDQFDAGQAWDVIAGARSAGLHAVASAHYDARTGQWWLITWGREQPTTARFMAAYVREAWVAIGPEWFGASGVSPSGLDRAALGHDFAVLTGEPSPFPAPTPPAPPRFPGALVAAVAAADADPLVADFIRSPGLTRRPKAVAARLAAILAAPRA